MSVVWPGLLIDCGVIPGIVCRGYRACFFVRVLCAPRQAYDVLSMDVPVFFFFIFLYARVLGVVFSGGRIARSFLRNDLIGTCARRIVFV